MNKFFRIFLSLVVIVGLCLGSFLTYSSGQNTNDFSDFFEGKQNEESIATQPEKDSSGILDFFLKPIRSLNFYVKPTICFDLAQTNCLFADFRSNPVNFSDLGDAGTHTDEDNQVKSSNLVQSTECTQLDVTN